MVTFAHEQDCPDGSGRQFDAYRGFWVEPEAITKSGPLDPCPPPCEPKYVEAVLADRGKTHGDYSDHAALTQRTKDLWRNTAKWAELDEHERETLDMIAHKVGRILSGNPHFNDHWLDIAGYATLSAQRNPVVK